MTDFLRVIEIGGFNINNADMAIMQLQRKVEQKCKLLRSRNPNSHNSYLKVEEDLKRLGCTPKTTYLYIQGHHLFDKVVVPMLTKICDKLIRQRQSEIARQSQHGTQRRNELSCYTNSLENVIPMLKKNMGFMLSEPFQRIRNDISNFMQNLNIQK
jgi:predicted DNA-binding transcriptional regulator AlpA